MKNKWRTVLIILGIFLAILLLIDFNDRMQKLNSLETSLNSVSAEGTSIKNTQDALITQVAYATSNNAVEQWAYENKWIRPGERPIALVPVGGATPTSEPVSSIKTESQTNWQIWWELFFGNSH
jgi:hypothetical protein